jgi:hypothetical protein
VFCFWFFAKHEKLPSLFVAPLLLTLLSFAPSMFGVRFVSQFVIGLVSLMDKLFKRVNLDLQLTPYRVLATSARDGFLEFIPDSQVRVCVRVSG